MYEKLIENSLKRDINWKIEIILFESVYNYPKQFYQLRYKHFFVLNMQADLLPENKSIETSRIPCAPHYNILK